MTLKQALARLQETLDWYGHADMGHEDVRVPVDALRVVVDAAGTLGDE